MKAKAEIDRTLSALADPNRRRTVDILSTGPRRAGELARALGLEPAAMSRHLRTLRQSGLIEETHPEFDARVRIYQLKREPMKQLKDWLSSAETMWVGQLTAFSDHIDNADLDL